MWQWCLLLFKLFEVTQGGNETPNFSVSSSKYINMLHSPVFFSLPLLTLIAEIKVKETTGQSG